ncbi:hypothetical protein [Ktedonobacter robiniae]|uniref:Helix-turn-helix domain-containing protein n=1 Tax=Ktedonobacter robiniae TaxID=2778365 RepID=A0ABQ3V2I8_9CHLR|nr:hypothetical protein [Ktedonobacter robiniae]GHO59173.1 hypothetical protein KSB_76480 [Ktedonobacter robiniae]
MEVKKQAVDLIVKEGYGTTEVSWYTGLPRATLYRWLYCYEHWGEQW